MNEFANGVILAIFGAIRVFCDIIDGAISCIFTVILAVYTLTTSIIAIIQELCNWIMHHKKPDNFFAVPKEKFSIARELWYSQVIN